MTTAKQRALEVLNSLPDDCSAEDIQYEIYVREAVTEGERAADEGRVLPHEQVMREARKRLDR